MKKFKQCMKDLFQSIYKTKSLFKFALYSWITPLVTLVFIILIMVIPSVVSYNTIKVSDITDYVEEIEKAFAYTLSQDINCKIEDDQLSCDKENYDIITYSNTENPLYTEIKYNIYVNYNNIANFDFSVGEFEDQPKQNENYILFAKNGFSYRYVLRNPATKTVTEYELTSLYTNLNGVDFHQIYEESLKQEDPNAYLIEQSNYLILEGYKGLASKLVLTTLIRNVFFYLIFVLFVALLFKGIYLFKKNKGLKYTQSIKIAIISSIQCVLISLPLALLGILDFISLFGLVLTIRTLYIYFRYTGSRKNTQWLSDLYELSKDERFKV